MDVGCVVQNVGTVVAVAEAVLEGKPLYERVTTVTGTPIARPGNWRFRIGTPFEKALELAGGTNTATAKIIAGAINTHLETDWEPAAFVTGFSPVPDGLKRICKRLEFRVHSS